MVLAFVLMGLILVATPWVYRRLGITPAEDTKKSTAAPKKSNPASSSASSTPSASGSPMQQSSAPVETASKTPAAASEGSVAAASAQDYTIDTSLYHVVFTNRGATVKSWTLKKFDDSANKPLELVNEKGAEKAGYPFSFAFRDKKPGTDLNKALWVAHPGGNSISFEFSDGETHATKTFAFAQDSYLVQYSDEVSQGGAGLAHLVQWRGGFGDMAVQNPSGQQGTIHYDLTKNKLDREAAKKAKDGPLNADGQFSFAGVDDQYFAAAFLPPQNTNLETTTYDDIVSTSVSSSEDPYPGVAVGGSARNQFGVFIGPKEINLLHQVNPKLDGIVDWGWFGLFARPLFIVLHYMNDRFLHNYGWSIVVLTIIISIATFPLKLSSLKSSRKMQAMQPELSKITDKYKGIPMSDPRAQQKQQEMMDLYKKHGVNPVGGCVPLLIQMPFIYAFYKVLAVTIELRHAPWLWVSDLSQHEHFEIHFLPLIMVVSSYALQKMTPTPTGGDPTQQKMMQFMPLMYLFIFWSLSSGVVLYWLTTNIVGLAQQWFFNKTAGPVEARAAAVAKKIIPKDGRKRA